MIPMRRFAKRVLPPRVAAWLRRRIGPTAAGSSARDLSGAPRRGPGPTVEHIVGLEVKLWSTGNDAYVDRLARSIRLMPPGSEARARGSMALAKWEFSRGKADVALQRLAGIRTSDPMLAAELELFRVDCLCEMGDGPSALTLLSRMAGKFTTDPDIQLRVGLTRALLRRPPDHGSGPVTESLNAIYHGAGFAVIRRTSVAEPVGLCNITCQVADAEPAESLPLVTVITWPSHSTEEIHVGIGSLLEQSWRNLEILVIGKEDTREKLGVINGAAVDDERLNFLDVQARDVLPWATVVEQARGEMITLHPAGSWAHPQRIETQATALLADLSLRGSISSHLRVNTSLIPRPLGIVPVRGLVGPNPYSLMIRVSDDVHDELTMAFRRFADTLSPLTGELQPPPGVAVVSSDVPLTLSSADVGHTPATETVPV